MKQDLSRGESLILRILRASTRGVEDVGRDLGNTANATRWITLDSSASECASNALMGYDVLLTGSIIPHRNRDELVVARQKYSDAWSVVLKEVGELLPGSEQYVLAMRLWRTVDASLVDYVEDCLCERNAASVAELKDALRGVSDELRRIVQSEEIVRRESLPFKPIEIGSYARQNKFSADRNKQIVVLRGAGKYFVSINNNSQWNVISALLGTNDPFGYADLSVYGKWRSVFDAGKSAQIPNGREYRGCKDARDLSRHICKKSGKSGFYRFEKKLTR